MEDLASIVDNLMKLPGSLCSRCGLCCNFDTYKGYLNPEQIQAIIDNPDADPIQRAGAKDFLSIFVPYENNDIVKKLKPEIYNSVVKKSGLREEEITFYYCRYYKNGCTNYENRPNLCRVYPVAHKTTVYFPGCGYKEQGEKNWAKIEEILKSLGVNDH